MKKIFQIFLVFLFILAITNYFKKNDKNKENLIAQRNNSWERMERERERIYGNPEEERDDYYREILDSDVDNEGTDYLFRDHPLQEDPLQEAPLQELPLQQEPLEEAPLQEVMSD